MAVEYKNYYQTLGLERDASPEDVRTAYRAMARKLHPDVCKESNAEQRFKDLSEAYEVLVDPDKRQRYDRLGANWQAGDDLPPPAGGPDFGSSGGDFGDFSDFFSTLFGGGDPFSSRAPRAPRRGRDHRAELALTLEDAASGATKSFDLKAGSETKTYDVTLPRGLSGGSRIRLAGQGGAGTNGGVPGDLLLVVRLLPHPWLVPTGFDLRTAVIVTPWEAALGAEVSLRTLDRDVVLQVPAGTSSGQVLRLRGQGMPKSDTEHGDLLGVVRIATPQTLSDRELELFEQLRQESEFRPDPRSERP